MAWPVVLLPDFLSDTWAMPTDSVEIYQEVEWWGPVPQESFTAVLSPEWAGPRTDGSEYALTCTAYGDDGAILARSTIVCRTGETLPEMGVPRHYRAPVPGPLEVLRLMTVTEADVDEFCEYSGARYAVSATMRDARRLGFCNLLVPGPFLALMHIGVAPDRPEKGRISVWSRGPVTAGAAVSMCRSIDNPKVSCVRAIGGTRPATIAVMD